MYDIYDVNISHIEIYIRFIRSSGIYFKQIN